MSWCGGEGGIESKQPLLDSGLFYFFSDEKKKYPDLAPMSKANPPSAPPPPAHHSLFLCSRDTAFSCSFETTGTIGQAVGTQVLPEGPGRAERDAVGAGREGKEVFPSPDLTLAVPTASPLPRLHGPVHAAVPPVSPSAVSCPSHR